MIVVKKEFLFKALSSRGRSKLSSNTGVTVEGVLDGLELIFHEYGGLSLDNHSELACPERFAYDNYVFRVRDRRTFLNS